MITINNIEKILSINSWNVEVMGWECEPDYYEFQFEHDNIHSALFKVHMNRNPDSGHDDTYTLKLWDGISNNPLEYRFAKYDVKDPFTLLKYLADVVYDWDNVTNK